MAEYASKEPPTESGHEKSSATEGSKDAAPIAAPLVQRARVLGLQRSVGNQAVAALLGRGAPSHSNGGHLQPPRGGRTIARAPAASIHRQVGIIEGRNITTYADLAGAYDHMAGQLTQSEFELRMGEAPLPRGPSLEDLREEALAAARAWAGNSDEVSDADYERALGFHTEFRASLDKAEDLKMKTAAARLKKAAADLQKAVNGSRSRILSKLADAQNGAYLADDEEALTTVVGIVGKANEYTTKLVEGQKAAHEAAAELANMVGKGVKCPTAVKYLGVFQALNYAKQAYDGLQAAISVASTGATGYSEAVAGIKATAGLAGVGGSILEATTGMKLATTPFFGEMLNAALKALNQAFKVSKAVALDAIKRGDYDVVDWNHFPGGRAMFDYMRAVMRAGGPGDIPQPVPQSISDYLVGRESEITAGLGGSEQAKEMPTEELLFWEEVDPKRISEWVFRYRQSLWAMFYGSLDAASLP